MGPKRQTERTDRNARSTRSRPTAPFRRPDPWAAPRRRVAAGLILPLGALLGVAAGYLLTDPLAWRQLRAAAGLPVAARPLLTGRPTHIADGDTFRFGATRVRLLGVDAPELPTVDGRIAKDHLAELIAASRGPLRCEDTGERTYERVVAQCFTAEGADLSAMMAQDGWATVMLRFSGWNYLPSQLQAMWQGQGMWNRNYYRERPI